MKPRLLDLFCGAGGAAMGYHCAGFEVVGVDIKPQEATVDQKGRDEIDRRNEARWAAMDEALDEREGR